jgi:tetratricopeptide (TPR) repeat protein
VAYQPVYTDLGLAYMRLGRYGEAVETFRYGREVDPRTPELYDLLASAYQGEGKPELSVVILLERIQLLGATSEALGRIARAYGDGSCAVERGSGWMRLNEDCPQIQGDLCAADKDLGELLRSARMPELSAQFAARAAKKGCGSGN